MHKYRIVAFLAVLLTPLAATAADPIAAETETDETEVVEEVATFRAVPDRPLYTAAPVTVAKGHGQLEVGGEFSTVDDTSQLAFPFLARVGLVDNLELRAGLPAVIVPLDEDTSSELGAIQVAAKVAGNVSRSFSLGALPYFDIAVSSGDETAFSQSTYGVKLLWGLDIVDAFGLNGNFGAAVGPSLEPGDGPRALSVSASLAALMHVGPLDVALEGFTYLVQDTPVVGGRLAARFAIFDTFVVDLSGGTSSLTTPLPGLMPDGTTGFVALGLTVAR